MPTTRKRGVLGVATRHRQLGELLRVVRLLARGQWTADELAAEAGIHRRTLYRTLVAMRSAGLEVERHREGPTLVHLRLSRASLSRWLWGST